MNKPTVLLIETGDDGTILHCSTHDDSTTAYGRAVLEMDGFMSDSGTEYYFTSLYRLENEAGFGFDAVNKDNEKDTLRAFIIDTDNDYCAE